MDAFAKFKEFLSAEMKTDSEYETQKKNVLNERNHKLLCKSTIE